MDPKKCLFGGVTRGRISSQCLKRNIRLSDSFAEAFGGRLAKRTKYLPRLAGDALAGISDFPGEDIEGVKKGLAALFKKEAKQEDSEEESGPVEESAADVTPQLVFFPPPFAEKLASLVDELRQRDPRAYAKLCGVKQKKLSKEEDKVVDKALAEFKSEAFKAKESMSVDVALFGRMTTSDLIADVEASCQVAHAISTHAALIEGDYFTAMDDLQGDYISSQVDGKGAAFLGSGDTVTFFNSAVYYKYLNVDVGALAGQLGEDRMGTAAKAAAVLVEAAALSTPTGKQNSFAAHSLPELILVEVSSKKLPLSYANAFLEPVVGGDLMAESARSLSDYVASIAAAYGASDTQRCLMAVGNAGRVEFGADAMRVDRLADFSSFLEQTLTGAAGGVA